MILRTLDQCTASVTFIAAPNKYREDEATADARDFFGLCALAANRGTSIVIEASGPGAAEAVQSLVDLFKSGFGED